MDESGARPREIELDRSRELRITWASGETCAYPLALLRRECPCAACRHERQQQRDNPLRVLPSVGGQLNMVLAERIELVGHYALRIVWADGHAAGIYDYGLLRSLSPATVKNEPPE